MNLQKQEYHKKYNIENKYKIQEYKKKWYIKNKEGVLQLQKKYIQENKAARVKYGKEWYEKNKSHVLQQQKDYYYKNKTKKLSRQYEYTKIKRKENVIWKLHQNTSRRIRLMIQKEKSTTKLISYTFEQLKVHLENQFTKEMSWDNYGSYWHVDHRIPISKFTIKTANDESFKRCWALENLQPLEAKKNIGKGNRYSEPTINQINEGVMELIS